MLRPWCSSFGSPYPMDTKYRLLHLRYRCRFRVRRPYTIHRRLRSPSPLGSDKPPVGKHRRLREVLRIPHRGHIRPGRLLDTSAPPPCLRTPGSLAGTDPGSPRTYHNGSPQGSSHWQSTHPRSSAAESAARDLRRREHLHPYRKRRVCRCPLGRLACPWLRLGCPRPHPRCRFRSLLPHRPSRNCAPQVYNASRKVVPRVPRRVSNVSWARWYSVAELMQ